MGLGAGIGPEVELRAEHFGGHAMRTDDERAGFVFRHAEVGFSFQTHFARGPRET